MVFVPVLADDTNETLFGRVLGAVYEILLANRPATVSHEAMQSAQVLVGAAREKALGGGFSLLGASASRSQSTSTTVPKDMLLDGPRVLRDLMKLVQESDAQGVLVHIDNLENLSDAAASNAGTIVLDLRDPLLMHNGLHIVVVGTPEAIQSDIMAHQQKRTTFSVRTLEPMPIVDVHKLLESRYQHLERDPSKPVTPPIDQKAVEVLYDLFRGDLRGLLQALDDGVTPNIGLMPVRVSTRSKRAMNLKPIIPPLQLQDIMPALRAEYQSQLAALPEEHQARRLIMWGKQDADATHTQQSLGAVWKVKQGTVSDALAYLVRQGYVAGLPRQGRSPVQYVLTGRSRLIFSRD